MGSGEGEMGAWRRTRSPVSGQMGEGALVQQEASRAGGPLLSLSLAAPHPHPSRMGARRLHEERRL